MKMGIDLGSSTAKVVLLSADNKLLFKTYQRHNGQVKATLQQILNDQRAALDSAHDAVLLWDKELCS